MAVLERSNAISNTRQLHSRKAISAFSFYHHDFAFRFDTTTHLYVHRCTIVVKIAHLREILSLNFRILESEILFARKWKEIDIVKCSNI